MAESGTHLPKKVFKAEKRSYIDDEKKRREKWLKKKEKFRYVSVRMFMRVVCERMRAIIVCACICEYGCEKERDRTMRNAK